MQQKKSRPAQTLTASLTPWRKPHKKGENPKKDIFYDGVPLSKSDYQKSALFFRMEPALKSLGQRLRLARRALHLSIADTAAKAGVSTETVRRLEKGGAGASLAVLYSILFVLGREKDFENLVVLSFEDGYMINNKLFTKDEEKEITDMIEKC